MLIYFPVFRLQIQVVATVKIYDPNISHPRISHWGLKIKPEGYRDDLTTPVKLISKRKPTYILSSEAVNPAGTEIELISSGVMLSMITSTF